MAGLIEFQEVYRDAIQSLLGTNPSADEIIAAHENAHLTGISAIQTGGGTFFDLFAKKGRNEWEEVEKIFSYYHNKGIRQSALIRGDFLFTYEPQPYDVIRATVFEFAKMGVNVLQNFHGMNDPRALVGVAQAVKEAQDEGHDIVAQGSICIEDTPNVTLERCLKFAQALVDMGHEGFYLKSASGRLDPQFVYELTSALCDRFPDQEITIHAHSTYGEAPICYMEAARATIERERKITMDVQHPAMSGSTAHPNMLKMLKLIQNHPDERFRDNAPEINIDALKLDMESLFALRFLYRDYESSYNPKLLEAMRQARTPGGASSTLRGIPGLEANLSRLLEETNWDKIQIAIYEMQARILDDLGQPTQVTPYALNTTNQAVTSLFNELSGKALFDDLHPGIVGYLLGRHGHLPDRMNEDLIDKAFAIAGYEESLDDDKVSNFLPALEERKEKLREAGIKHPTHRQVLINSLLGRHGLELDPLQRDLFLMVMERDGLKQPVGYVMSTDRPPALELAREKLRSKGIDAPTDRQAISAVMLADGVQHVLACYNGTNRPQMPPALPLYAQPPKKGARHQFERDEGARGERSADAQKSIPLRDISDAIHVIGGPAKLQELAERALHLKQIDDNLYLFPEGKSDLKHEWREGNLRKIMELLDGINDMLEAAGFVSSQITFLTTKHQTQNVHSHLKDACDAKGLGLFEHMMENVEQYRRKAGVASKRARDAEVA